MDKIDQKLNDLYRNWQAEYKNAVTPEDCDKVGDSINPFWINMNPNTEYFTKCFNK